MIISRELPLWVCAVAASYDLRIQGLSLGTTSSTLEVVVHGASAYAVGVAISTLAHLIHWPTWFLVFPALRFGGVPDRLARILKTATNTSDLTLNWNPIKAEALLDHAHDLIKQKIPSERLWVTKLFAELSLLYGLTVATTVACLLVGNSSTCFVASVAFFVAAVIRSIRTCTVMKVSSVSTVSRKDGAHRLLASGSA